MVLVDRSAERGLLDSLAARAAEGLSGSLVLRGEPGTGKTALLDDMAATAASRGMRTARLAGVEPEIQLGYAALHRFLLLFPDHTDRLPAPQRSALHSTFGLVAGPPADRFLVALGVLTLLADVASEAPLVCLVDDVQWLDLDSAVVLGFVARRLYAEQVVLLFAMRNGAAPAPALAGLPELAIGGLADHDAAELLASLTGGRLNPAVGARLVTETGGNPLALVELAKELSPAQLAGAVALPDPLPAGSSLERVFSRRLGRLPAETRLLMAVAAAGPTAPPDLLWRAARQLGIDPDAAASADAGDLVAFGPEIAFRHPLVRSVIYHDTPLSQRRLVHRALAAVGEESMPPDRVAWHLAMAAAEPDDDLAARLEQAAEGVRKRGGYAAVASFLSLAAELSVDKGLRTGRLLAAADAELTAGAPDRASARLDQLSAGPATPLQQGLAVRLSGQLSLATGQLTDAPAQLLAAARTLTPIDPALGRRTLLRALEAANFAGRGAVEEMRAVAAEILPAESAEAPAASIADRLLSGFLHWFAGEHRQAAPLLRSAIVELHDERTDEQARLAWLQAGCFAASELLDDQERTALAADFARLARKRGALTALPLALTFVGEADARAGRFDQADAAHAEGRAISAATGNPGIPGRASPPDLLLLVWRGRGSEARAAAATITAEMSDRGIRSGISYVHTWLAVLEVGLGKYREALRHAQRACREDSLATGCFTLPELVEAAVRCGELDAARQAVTRLAARALAGGAPWGLGLLARSRALLAGDDEAEDLYQQAIALLGRTQARTDLARAHLIYGEWLRRQRRRRDARDQLRTAHDMLADMGAAAFAERAWIELNATGGQPRKRSAETTSALTSQEAQIARLVSDGLSNRDVAAQLFLSPATVEYHLRSVYRKLGVTSRTQLARTVIADDTSAAGPVIA
jgi:DNA-binding CsgD family transcriptional regulator